MDAGDGDRAARVPDDLERSDLRRCRDRPDVAAAGRLTLAFIAPTTAEGVTYRCPIKISSQTDPTVSDTIVAIMTTY